MRNAAAIVLVVCLAGCGSAPDSGTSPAGSSAPPSSTAAPPSGPPASAVAYANAWAANDVATMVRNSAPGSPARDYARYWGEVYAAGRLDSGQAQVDTAAASITLRYQDATTYRLSGFRVDDSSLLVTWTARPGGPLAPRIVSGQAVNARVGPVRVGVGTQYVNSDGDLRVAVRVHNSGASRADVAARSYRSPDGHSSPAAIGSGASTGVVRIPPGESRAALVTVAQAQPGGQLVLESYDRTGRTLGEVALQLPQ